METTDPVAISCNNDSAGLGEVRLAAFLRPDCATLARWLGDVELVAAAFPGWNPPVTPAFIEREYFEKGSSGDHLRVEAGGKLSGHLGLRTASEGCGHLYHVLVDPGLRGRGYGAAMMHAVCRLAFEKRRLHRLSLHVFDDNASAIACYVRTGFRVEGRHRDAFRQGGRWRSWYTMAMLDSEWRGTDI